MLRLQFIGLAIFFVFFCGFKDENISNLFFLVLNLTLSHGHETRLFVSWLKNIFLNSWLNVCKHSGP